MNSRALVLASLSLVGAAMACSDSGDAANVGGGSSVTGAPGVSSGGATGGGTAGGVGGRGIPCDVDAVLEKSCRNCHGAKPSFGAPMPLVTHADLVAAAKSDPGQKVYEQVMARVHDTSRPMPPPPNAALSASELALLDSWISAGAPAATEVCGGGAGSTAGGTNGGTSSTGVKPLSCTPDQHIRPTSSFAVPLPNGTNVDTYACYGFDVDVTDKRHVIALAPRIDNTRVVHHLLLFQADQAVSGTPASCAQGANTNWRLITGWAPGGDNMELPIEAGFPEEKGTTHWVMQVHYNNAQAVQDATDASGFDMCTTDQLRPNDADIMATGSLRINIPARSTYETTCEYTWPSRLPAIHVFGASPHMHRLGRASYVKHLRGGKESSILDVPNFDFANGGGGSPVNQEVAPGDVLRTMCRWQNTGDSAVTFGEGTADEMCFDFQMYYPKITASQWQWMTPSLFAKCQ